VEPKTSANALSTVLRSRVNGRRLGQLWSSRLWLVAAVLGASTLYSAVSAVHDRSQRVVAVGLIAQATATHSAALASARLERLALEAFAPAGPLTAEPLAPDAGRKTIDLLVRRQRDARACAPCRDLLPVSHFFFYDPQTRALVVEPVDSGGPSAPTTVIADLARTESDFARGVSNAAARIVADARLGDRMSVMLVQRDDHGTAVGVYGMLVDTGDTFSTLFAPMAHHSPLESGGLTQLDSLSLEVRGADNRLLFGKLGQGRALAVVGLGGPLRDLKLTMAIAPSRVASPLLQLHSPMRLWNMAALMAATLIVIALAITASRRELHLERARSDFIAGISHDLRMPLAQILIASETIALARERDATDRASLANSIIREARRLIGLVDNVLLFSRSGAVELEPVIRAVPVPQLLGDVADAVRLSVEDAGQVIEVMPTSAQAVMADGRLVRQALVNLVDNALKYGSVGQRIVLSAAQHGDMLRVFVDDEGPGIPPSERDRIFEPYARLEHDQSSERTGSGLGLAVVRQIIDACGGRVWVEERQPRGLRAVVELGIAS
jgi:signal transduction histidine kinase